MARASHRPARLRTKLAARHGRSALPTPPLSIASSAVKLRSKSREREIKAKEKEKEIVIVKWRK
jgi:hypothetical protein